MQDTANPRVPVPHGLPIALDMLADPLSLLRTVFGFESFRGVQARVVERYDAIGARGLRTSASGAITFRLQPGRPLEPPREWRLVRPKPWRDP